MGLLDELERTFVRFFARQLELTEDDFRERAGVPPKEPKKRIRTHTPPKRPRQRQPPRPRKGSRSQSRKQWEREQEYDTANESAIHTQGYHGRLVQALNLLGMPTNRDYDDPVETRGLIKAAWKEQAKKHHPDRNPGDKAAAEKMAEVNAAVDFLLGALNDNGNNNTGKR